MADNLAIKGIEDDTPRRRGKKCRSRKLFAIESRYRPDDRRSVFRCLNLYSWWVHGHYETASRRDQAYAALVKKEKNARRPWGRITYRKRDD
jgi:hypothetical protein